MSSDYITLLTAPNAANKIVSVVDGKAEKSAANAISEAIAETLHVPDVQAMVDIQNRIANDPCLLLMGGFIPEMVGKGRYQILSKAKLKKQGQHSDMPSYTRTKDNFVPSSWWQIDRDHAPGCPKHLSKLSEQDYIKAIDSILPGFKLAGRVRVASTSGRVLLDGKPIDSNGCRYWFQVDNADAQRGFGRRLKVKAAAAGLGFSKTDKNGKGALWAIFDPSVFSAERIVFDGMPTTINTRLSLRDPDIQMTEGGRVSPGDAPPITSAERRDIKDKYGIVVSGSGGNTFLTNENYLTLDTRIETFEHGHKTVREFLKSGAGKWKCQATYRESTTWNGALQYGRDGMPHLMDYGGETKYVLALTEQAEAARIQSRVKKHCAAALAEVIADFEDETK